MSNTITIELCAEDRARLDRIADRLEAQIALAQYIIDNGTVAPTKKDEPKEAVEAEKTTQDATEETTPTITPQVEEKPTAEEPTKAAPTKTVSRAELGAKVREMMTKGFKEETKAIVKDYAPTVPGVPEDKVTECYERLAALEG